MNIRTVANALVFGLVWTFMSCSLSNDDYTYSVSDDAALTSVTFGTLYRNYPKGEKDSVVSYSASSYAVQIDQINKTITNNLDSLPMYTDMKRIVLNATTMNSGVAALWVDSLKTYYPIGSGTELDFSSPRDLFVFSTDGTAKATYKVDFVAHKEKGDTVTWGKYVEVDVLKGATDLHAISFNGRIYVLGRKDDARKLYVGGAEQVADWSEVTQVALSANSSIAAGKGKLYACDKDAKKMYSTSDGSNWTAIACDKASEIKTLVGVMDSDPTSTVSPSYEILYALTDGNAVIETKDGGTTWQDSDMDAGASLTPSSSISSCLQSAGTGMERLFMVGTRDGQEYATVWSKLHDPDIAVQEPWTYMPFAVDRAYKLPALRDLSVTACGNYLLAVGTLDKDSELPQYKRVYSSADHGITWKIDSVFVLPGLIVDATDIELITHDNRLWLICGGTGDVWRGRLNSMTWKNNKTSFK